MHAIYFPLILWKSNTLYVSVYLSIHLCTYTTLFVNSMQYIYAFVYLIKRLYTYNIFRRFELNANKMEKKEKRTEKQKTKNWNENCLKSKNGKERKPLNPHNHLMLMSIVYVDVDDNNQNNNEEFLIWFRLSCTYVLFICARVTTQRY